MSNVKIVMADHGRGEVFIDGVKLDGVRAVSMSAEVDCANSVTLTMIPAEVEIEGVFDITTIGHESREFAKVA